MSIPYVVVDDRTVVGPDGQHHDVVEAIGELSWTPQLCPLMPHEYSFREKDGPAWAWHVIVAMLPVRSGRGFRAYFGGYPTANNYWDGPDDWRYWRSGQAELDRGRPYEDDLRRVANGAKPVENTNDPRWSLAGLGLYEKRDKGGWWPTKEALDNGYQPCRGCQRLSMKGDAIQIEPADRDRTPALIAEAEQDSVRRLGRGMTREELTTVLRECIREMGANH